MPDPGPLAGAWAELAASAIAALLRTAAGMFLLTSLLGAGAFYLAAQGSPARGVVALLLTLGLGAVIGGMLAAKRAVLTALLRGLGRLDLGRRTLGLVFDRLLAAGRGGSLAQAAGRLPLAEAEARLTQLVDGLIAAPDGGWRRRQLQARLLESVRRVTLARFRSDGQAGVDLGKVRDELAGQVNALLGAQVSAVRRKVTAGLALLLAALSLALALAVRRLPI